MEHLEAKKEKRLILAEMFINKENKILRKTEISTNDSGSENVVIVVSSSSISKQQLVSSYRPLERNKYRFENFKVRSFTSVSTNTEIRSISSLNRHTVRLFTESDDTRGCNNTICPPEDEQDTARNMLRIIM
jgi:hypothetical protein